MIDQIRIHPKSLDEVAPLAEAQHDSLRTETSLLPAAGRVTPQALADTLHLPKLPLPLRPVSIENLMESLDFNTRRQACRQGMDSIDANARDQKRLNAESVSKMVDNLRKMEEAQRLQGLLKILGIFGFIVTAVLSVVSLGSAGPLMAVMTLALTLNSLLTTVTDGKVGLGALFKAIGKGCGMSDTDAQWFSMGMELGCTLITLGAGLAGSLLKNVSKVGETVAKNAQQAFKLSSAASFGAKEALEAAPRVAEAVAKNAAEIAQTMRLMLYGQRALQGLSGALTLTRGGVGIAAAVAEGDALHTKADTRKLDALLTRMREMIEAERKMVQLELERCNDLMVRVKNIVDGCNDAQDRIAESSPQLA